MHPRTDHPTPTRPLSSLAVGIGMLTILPLPNAIADPSKDKEKKSPSPFPTLNVLPEGSILRRVRLPRYDQDFNPLSLLEAKQLTVVDGHRIKAQDVTLQLFGKDGSTQITTKMRHCIYNQKLATLNATHAIYLNGNNYTASGTGLIFNLDSRRGFIHGPVSTRFYIAKDQTNKKKDTTMHSPLTPQLRPPILATSIATFATSLIASPPAPLSQEQLTELDQLAKPTAEQTLAQQNETKQTIESEKKLHTQSRASMKPFLEKIGQGALLAQAPAPQAEPENPQPKDPQTPPEKPGHTSLLVECDGGLYFDNDTGILAYLKNIRLTETRFKLTCSDELKVFLAKKEPAAEEPDKDTDTPEEKQPGDEAEEKEDNLSSFGEVSKIIATGNVKITRKDDKGRPFIATGETASYDATTGEIILRGGRPRLQQSKNQYLQAQEPGAWIRIFKNGKLVTSNNKWQMFIVRDNPAPQP